MVGCNATLLHDWELLQEQVIPPLLEVVDEQRAPRSWSIGVIEDAAAVGVAFQTARGSGIGEPLELFASTTRPERQEVGFAFADLKRIPLATRTIYFERHNRRWRVGDEIAEHVVLDEPSDVVDLLTFRCGARKSDRRLGQAVEQLNPGGHLLLIRTTDSPRSSEPDVLAEFELVEASGCTEIYRKCAGSVRLHRATPDRDHVGPEPETLARARLQDELVADHLRLARSLARRFAYRGAPTDDLEQVAMMALVTASKRFDPSLDTRFATYATTSILGELKRYFRDKSWTLRVPRPVQERYLEVKQARDELTHRLASTPTARDIAGYLETSVESVEEALLAGDNFWPTSLDGPTGDDEQSIQIASDDVALDRAVQRLHVEQLIPTLDDREQLLLKRLYFENCTQREVADELGISQMQVSRVLALALAKLRG